MNLNELLDKRRDYIESTGKSPSSITMPEKCRKALYIEMYGGCEAYDDLVKDSLFIYGMKVSISDTIEISGDRNS